MMTSGDPGGNTSLKRVGVSGTNSVDFKLRTPGPHNNAGQTGMVTPPAEPTPTPTPQPVPTATPTPTPVVPDPGQWGLFMMAVVVGAGLLLLGRGGARPGRQT